MASKATSCTKIHDETKFSAQVFGSSDQLHKGFRQHAEEQKEQK